MRDRIGIGIIGTGFARRVQIPAFKTCEGAAVLSVASGSLDNAQGTADEFGIGHLTDDWRDTVLHPEVDLVCITTPPDLHLEVTLFALKHSKHVICEKPMAMNVAEAEEMARAAEGQPLLALIDHELRFQPGRLLAYSMLRDGAIGKVRHAKAVFQAPLRGDPGIAWNWWSDAAAGGGALGAIGSHVIDSFHWFLGADMASVFCQLQTHIKERRTRTGEVRTVTSDDEANMLLRFADGEITEDATGLVSVSMTENPKYQNTMEFYGTAGAMRVGHLGEVWIAKAGESDWTEIDVDLGDLLPGMPDTGFARAFLKFAPKIVDAIRRGETSIEHAATFADGVRVQWILDAARESNSTGRAVAVSKRRI
ncbi:MAG: Gfo/Idh/MocA family oxidoreductase [Pyrinomonadaceae bacterium]